MSYLGTRIKAVRKVAGLTSAQLAARVQRTPQYLRLIECGGATPSMQTTLALANEFPDEDTAEWLWLLLADLWGPAAVTLMKRHAQAGDGGRA